ncbi:hypothetical protein CsatA_029342 [Cannabis sativa]|uniref:Uncharacterized protein n=1 Tax=Cannabis sativa TaxID=3483 RepID=A0A803NHY8_CANSA
MTGLWMHFDLDKVVNVLQSDGYLRKPAEHCLSVFGQKLIEGLDTGSVWKLDEKKVCVHFAKQILKGGKKKMESFIEWKKKIPEGLQINIDMLKGEVLTERLGVDAWVYAFSSAINSG